MNDFFAKGKAVGSVAKKLLACGFNVNALRTNDTLLYDEWKEIDKAVLKSYQQRLVGVADLESRGLVYNIGNGMAKTVLAYQDASDTEVAQMSMDGKTRGQRDRPEFDINYLPLPIIHKDFSFSAREIQASRNGNMPLDTTMAELAARKVAEKIEELLFVGSGSYTFGGGTIHGYTTHSSRNTGSLNGNWDDSATSADNILDDVLSMKQALINDRCYGPYMLYIPTNFETAIEENYSDSYPGSIRQRLMQIDNLLGIKVADKLTADNVVMVQMTSDVVRMVNGLEIQTLEWEEEGGLDLKFKVMAIKVPQIRADQDGRCGVAHWS